MCVRKKYTNNNLLPGIRTAQSSPGPQSTSYPFSVLIREHYSSVDCIPCFCFSIPCIFSFLFFLCFLSFSLLCFLSFACLLFHPFPPLPFHFQIPLPLLPLPLPRLVLLKLSPMPGHHVVDLSPSALAVPMKVT